MLTLYFLSELKYMHLAKKKKKRIEVYAEFIFLTTSVVFVTSILKMINYNQSP